MITLISTPACSDTETPPNVSRWVATESPNNFRLFREDFLVASEADNGGFLEVTLSVPYTGISGNSIAVYNFINNAMYVGLVTNVSGAVVTTDIPWIASMDIRYLNDNSLHAGYFFEGRLTINGAVEPLTIAASPDSFGYADLDVSGVLRIKTSLGKVGDYSALIMKETNKSGSFEFEYRERWFGDGLDDEDGWIWADDEAPFASPPLPNTWYYAECIRSEEQGSNLSEYVATPVSDAPFLNQFDNPVYFLGLPFDLSFILPEFALISPGTELIVTQKIYNALNVQLGADIVTNVDADSLEGFVNSLNIDPATIPVNASYFTIEIEIP